MYLKTTAEFIDDLKTKLKLAKDADIARQLGITSSSVSQLRNLKNTFDDTTALKVAELLGIEPGYVVVCARAQGAKRPDVRAVWERIARAAGTAAAVLITLGFFAVPDTARAHGTAEFLAPANIHYAKFRTGLFG